MLSFFWTLGTHLAAAGAGGWLVYWWNRKGQARLRAERDALKGRLKNLAD